MTEKNTDTQGRFRCKAVSFHMSPQEAELLNKYVAMSGLTKRAYINQRIMLPEVKVYGNPKVHHALKAQMLEIIDELKRIEKAGDLTPDFISLMQFAMNIYDGLKEEF